jgi:hypothetical protein
LKPSPIYDVFFALILYLLILSLAKKFDSINLEFGPKKCNRMKKKLRMKLKKNKNFEQ